MIFMANRNSIRRLTLICSTEIECEEILRVLKRTRKQDKGHFKVYTGRFSDKAVNIIVGGPGKSNAASSTTLAALVFDPELIINLGIAGAFRGTGPEVGDIAICTEDVYLEEGVLTKRGFSPLRSIGLELLPGRNLYNRIPFDTHMTNWAYTRLSKKGFNVYKGRFITVSTITGTSEQAKKIRQKYRCLCESMEGAAVGHIALGFRIPALQIRGISNMVEQRRRHTWKIKEAALNCQKGVISLIDDL